MRIDVTLLGTDGRPRELAVQCPDGTDWAQVARASSLVPQRVWCGAREIGPGAVVGRGALHDGAVLSPGPSELPGPRTPARTLDVVAGPDAGRVVALGRAPVTVGRAPGCQLVLHDPRLSRVHAEVIPTPSGATIRDRGSAAGTRVESTPAGATPAPFPVGHYARAGDTFLRVAAGSDRAAATRAGPDGTTLVHRSTAGDTAPAGPDPVEIALPAAPTTSAAGPVPWVAALLPAAVGVPLAVALHSAEFLLFALLSPLMLVGTAVGERVRARRAARRGRAEHGRALARAQQHVAAALTIEVEHRRARAPDPPALERIAALPSARLWERERDGPGLLAVRLGLGDVPAAARVRDGATTRPAGTVRAVPVSADLGRGPLGIAGSPAVARAVARWVLAQLAVLLAPDDVRLRLLLPGTSESAWRWARWLPHLDAPPAPSAAGCAELLAELGSLHEARAGSARTRRPWTVVLVDACDGPPEPSWPGELFRAGPRGGVTAIVVAARPADLPAGCATVVSAVGDTGTRLDVRGGPQLWGPVVADQVSEQWCDRVARSLAPLRSATGTAAAIPAVCSLGELLGGAHPGSASHTESRLESITATWARAGPGLDTVLGLRADGPVRLDLARDGPHALVAGTTGAGKSELLRSLVTGLAVTHPPTDVTFVLVDYKGGAAFAGCADLPHTAGVVTDLDAHLSRRALASLECELRRREHVLAAAGCRDLAAYRARSGMPPLSRLVIVVDEFAELAGELPDFVSGLVGVARRGRSLGVHLVLATQRPAGVVSAEIRANAAVRIALRVTDSGDSQDVLDAPDAAGIDPGVPGRAFLRIAGTPLVELQTALVRTPVRDGPVRVLALDGWRRPLATDAAPVPDASGPPGAAGSPDDGTMRQWAAVLSAAAGSIGAAAPHRPWLPPLPARVPIASLTPDTDTDIVLGLVDLPAAQRQRPLVIDPASGGAVLFAGGPRSGRTSGLRTLAVGAAGRLAPQQLHLHVADHAGGALAALDALPHCASLAVDDIATSARLIARLSEEVARRRARPAPAAGRPDRAALLFLLDGWEAFCAEAETHDGGGTVEALLALLRAGPSAGLTVAITGDRGALVPRLAAAVGTKLLLPLTDPGDYALAGIATHAVPADRPAGRAVRAGDSAEIQLAHLGSDPGDAAAIGAIAATAARWPGAARPGGSAIRVRALPTQVRLAELTTAPVPPGHVLLGVGGDGAEPLCADLFAGRGRVLVAGPPGSGRSTLLLAVLAQLTDQRVPVLVAAPSRSPLLPAARARGVPLLTPDEEVPGEGVWEQAAPEPDGDRSAVLLVDDCDAFTDLPAGDVLTAWLRRPGRVVVAAGDSDALAVAFRGLGAELRRARCAVLLRPGPGDGDLIGVRLSGRRTGGQPGHGLLVGDPAWGPPFGREPLPIQVALP